jgi:hypothetical protein
MSSVATPNPRDQRTYYLSDERLRAFAQLSYAQRLQWVEQCSQFVRLAQQAMAKDNKIRHADISSAGLLPDGSGESCASSYP